MAAQGEEYEQVLLVVREVFCYRVKAMSSASGYKCAEWDLANPALSGSLKLVGRGSHLFLRLYQADESLFAETEHLDVLDPQGDRERTFQAVTDSSRYFVVRLFNAKTNQRASLGIGFRERSTAFDFNAAIDDFIKKVKRQAGTGKPEYAGLAAQAAAEREESERRAEEDLQASGSGLAGLSLSEGQTIRVALKTTGASGAAKKSATPAPAAAGSGSGGSGRSALKLAAPPRDSGPEIEEDADEVEDEDEWGDFNSA